MIVGLLIVVGFLFSGTSSDPTFVGPGTRIYRFTSMPGFEDNPSWSPDGKFLAYETDENGQTDIMIQPADGGNPVRRLSSSANEVQATWSPDGSLLAFVSSRNHGGHFSPILGFGGLNLFLDGKGGDVFVVKAFGGEPLRLVSNAFDPAWSPDGKEIVFRSARDGQWDLWRIAASGGEPTRVTNDRFYDFQPAWSPDGQWVVYGSTEDGEGFKLFALRPSGGPRIPLTHGGSLVAGPEFADDGESILFSSSQGGTINLWKMPFSPDGPSAYAHRVTIGQGADVNVSTSRDGKKIAYASIESGPDVWELAVASGRLRRVTSEKGVEQQVSISPDGTLLAMRSDRGGTNAIWIADLDGTFQRLLTTNGGIASWSPNGKFISTHSTSAVEVRSVEDLSSTIVIPDAAFGSWDPSGTKIVFVRTMQDRRGIWARDLETGKDELIASVEGAPLSPVWSPDGRMILFNEDVGDKRRLLFVPASGGTPRTIPTDDAEYSHPVFSRIHSDRVVCVRDHIDIVEVSISTGKVTYLKKFEDPAIRLTDYPSWSPDGKKVYFDQIRRSGDIFVMEN